MNATVANVGSDTVTPDSDPVNGSGAVKLNAAYTEARPCGSSRLRSHASDVSATAFTIVELLVVIALVAVLVALLLPALVAARASAQQAVCLSNVRQVGAALALYTNENRQTMPDQPLYDTVANFADDTAPRNFLRPLLPHLGNADRVLRCPAAEAFYIVGLVPAGRNDTNYLGNAAVMGQRTSRFDHASDLVFLQELRWRISGAQLRPMSWTTAGSGPFGVWHDSAFFGFEIYNVVHRGGAWGNLLFADGHAEARRYDATRSGDFGLVPDEPWSPANTYASTLGVPYTARW